MKNHRRKNHRFRAADSAQKNAMGNGFPRRFFYHFYIKKGQNVSLCEIKTTLMHCRQCDMEQSQASVNTSSIRLSKES